MINTFWKPEKPFSERYRHCGRAPWPNLRGKDSHSWNKATFILSKRNFCKLLSKSSSKPLWHRIILFWHIINIKENLMPIWTVSFCQLLPPPAAKLHWLQAIQLPCVPSAKGEQAANTAPSGWAGSQPGFEGGCAVKHGSPDSAFQWVLFVFAFFFWSSTVGGCWGHHPFPGNGSKTCWSFFLCLLCTCWHPLHSHSACTQSLAGTAWSCRKWCHLSKTGFP